jgi:uncharacterized DUF497 family protein
LSARCPPAGGTVAIDEIVGSCATIVHKSGNGRALDDDAFDWDDTNRNHVLDGGVEPEEAQEALLDPLRVSRDVYNAAGERRRGAIGAAENGRILLVVFSMRRPRARVITARDAPISPAR